jgi:hypothetical protein
MNSEQEGKSTWTSDRFEWWQLSQAEFPKPASWNPMTASSHISGVHIRLTASQSLTTWNGSALEAPKQRQKNICWNEGISPDSRSFTNSWNKS